MSPNLTAGKAFGIVVGAVEGLLRGDVVRLEDFERETSATRHDNPDDLGVPRMH